MKDFIQRYKHNIFIIFILGLGIYAYIILAHNPEKIIFEFTHIKIIYFLIAIVLLFIFLILESWVFYIFATKKVKGIRYRDIFKMNLVTQFFNNLTPFAAGGQPFQVYYLASRGIKVREATSIVVMNFITWSIAFDLVAMVALLFKYEYFVSILNGKNYLLIIGFALNIFVTGLTFFLAFSKKFYHLLIEILWVRAAKWKILRRFKLENKTEKIKESINDFNREIKELNHHKMLWVESLLLHIIRIAILYSIPLFIFASLNLPVKSMALNIVVGAFFVAMVMSYFPSPGASGGAEFSFFAIFASLFNLGNAPQAIDAGMFMWRLLTYYFLLVVGFIALMSMNYIKNLNKLNYPEEYESNVEENN